MNRRNFLKWLGVMAGWVIIPDSHAQTLDQKKSLDTLIDQIAISSPTQNIQKKTQDRMEALLRVKKEEDGLFYVTYTENGEQMFKSLVSPWKPQWDKNTKRIRGQKTSEGTFTIRNKEILHHSSLYDDAKMPYAMHFHGHLFFHEGRVNGKPLSHGCIRLPKWKARELYHLVNIGTKVIIEDTEM